MLEIWVIGGFVAGLVLCIWRGASVLSALLFGLLLFCLYAWKKGFSPAEILDMLWEGVHKVSNILLIFVLIGCLTGIWRVCGTIPFIVYHGVGLIVPRYFVLCAFVLCSAMSYLTGTSFGTVSTMGVICMMLGRAAGVSEPVLAGAILSGCFFGDRCSPMSSSALLVAELTKTDIFQNVRTMFRTAGVPLVLTCAVCFFQGSGKEALLGGQAVDIFREAFVLDWPVVLPALTALVLCACKVEVKRTMAVSIMLGMVISLTVQQMPINEVLQVMLAGYYPEHSPELQALLGGGGVRSMVNVGLIVCVSASYSGIFERTGILDGMMTRVEWLAGKITPYGAFCVTAVLTCMVSCNQTLAAILTERLCEPVVPDSETRASWLEDTVIVLAPLIPWSIAGAVPVSVMGSTAGCLKYACYLYLIPLWNFLAELVKSYRGKQGKFLVEK